MDTPDTSVVVKRALRTYGRPRRQVPEPEQDHDDPNDTSFTASSNGDASHDHILDSPGAKSLPPDSSDNEGLLDSSMTRDEEEEGGITSFGWSERIKALDNDDLDDVDGAPPPGELTLGLSRIYGEEVLGPSHTDRSASPQVQRAHSSPKAPTQSKGNDMRMDISDNDLFEGPLPILTESSQPTAFSSQSDEGRDVHEDGSGPVHSQAASPSTTRRVRKRRAMIDSDSDSDSGEDENKGKGSRERAQYAGRERSASPQTSPDKLHHINTPEYRASQTPPTSQEMPPKKRQPATKPKRSTVKNKGKGKAKPAEARTAEDSGEDADRERENGEQDSDDESDRRRGRDDDKKSAKRKVKAPTKKELLETRKATARIKADQHASIPRTENRFRITELFARLAPLIPANSSTDLPSSDPIQDFSSSPERPPPKPRLITPPIPGLRLINAKGKGKARASTAEPSGTGPVFASGISPSVIDRSKSTGKAREKLHPGDPARRASSVTRSRAGTPLGDTDVFMASAASTSAAMNRTKAPEYTLPPVDQAAEPESDDSDREMPSVSSILEEHRAKREAQERAELLRRAKLALLERQKQEQEQHEDTFQENNDDDLEIVPDDMHEVVKEEERARRVKRVSGVKDSVGRRRQMIYARVNEPAVTKVQPKMGLKRETREDNTDGLAPLKTLEAAARSTFVVREVAGPSTGANMGTSRLRSPVRVNPKDLNNMLLQASSKQSRALALQKEREFYRREDDALPSKRWRAEAAHEKEIQQRKMERMQELAQRGIEIDKKREAAEESSGEEEDDGEWVAEEEGEEDENSEPAGDLPVATEDEGDQPENGENDENALHAPHKRAGPSRMVVDSDDENNERNALNRSKSYTERFGRVLVPASSSQPAIPSDDPEGDRDDRDRDRESPVPALNHRRSTSPEDTDRFEDGTDKENNEFLKYDHGENKENTAIAHEPLAAPLFSPLRRMPSALLFSPVGRSGDGERPVGVRTPLQEIMHEEPENMDDPFGPVNPVGISSSTPQRSRQGTPKLRGSKTPQPLSFDGGLEDLFNEGSSMPAPAADVNGFKTPGPSVPAPRKRTDEFKTPGPSLGPPAVILPSGGERSISQFFSDEKSQNGVLSAVPKAARDRGWSQYVTPPKGGGLDRLRQAAGGMTLTMEARQQPELSLDEKELQKADEILQEDQGHIVITTVAEAAQPESFVNIHGFPTQHQPPSVPPAVDITPFMKQQQSSGPRQPLRTIAMSPMVPDDDADDEDAEEEAMPRRGRLRKRASTPEGGYRSSPSPSPVKARNAFDVLGKRVKPLKALPIPRLGKSEFIEGEAVESDDDQGWPFSRKNDDDDEADGEDQDGILHEMVDDEAMDEATLAEAKVREKVQEQAAEDDARVEKQVVNVVEGGARKKRRNNGLDLSDSETDEDDSDAERRRKKIHKKRRIDGDTLDKLEKHEETRAFVHAYSAELEDDNEEFAHLAHDEYGLLALGGNDADVDDDGEEDEDTENRDATREVVSAADLHREIRAAAREKNFNVINPEDVSWTRMDDDEDMDAQDENVNVREVSTAPKKPPPRPGQATGMEPWEMLPKPSRGGSAQDVAREQQWARSEGGARHAGTGRGSAAVTSMMQSKSTSTSTSAGRGPRTGVKAGAGSVGGRRQLQAGPSTNTAVRRTAPLGKAPSALGASALSRRAKFGK